MKTNAIVRIILFSLVILLLLGVLLTGLGIGAFMFNVDSGTQSYTSGGDSIAATEINSLAVEWSAGKINIICKDTDTISFTESGSNIDENSMVYTLENGKLTIQYSKPAFKLGFFSFTDKDLSITVPNDWQCASLEIDAASAEIKIESLNADKTEIDTASGECNLLNCIIGTLDIDSASGEIKFSGELNKLQCDAASADVTAILNNVPDSIEMDSASGDLNLTLPNDCGFTVSLDSMSGDFDSEFPTTKNNGKYICGDGNCQIDMDCASGNIKIKKAT